MSDTWTEYEAWNEAIASVVFPELETPKPVYLDLEYQLLQELGQRMSVETDLVETTLARVVSRTLVRERGPSRIFSRHLARMYEWARDGREDPPPFLAVLAVFSIAAEKMAAGEGMSSNNYYGRLRSLLGWDDNAKWLDQGYRQVAERLWSEHNRWLIELDGVRGMPTAYALSHRYVGLSVSQALIRSADHERLKGFFRQFGFTPGAEVAPTDLVLALDDWMRGNPSPVSAGLQRLWRQSSARDRIAEAAAVSLASWDGSVQDRADGDPSQSSASLALTLELGGFPRKRFALSALFYLSDATTPRIATVLTAHPPTEIELVPDLPGALGLGLESSLHAGDVLEGVLRIRDERTSRVLERRPRRLVVFREDDLSRRWIECPQVMLGDTVRILVQGELLGRVEHVLNRVARPGWRVVNPYPGQPEEWSVLTDVEVFSHPGDLVSTNRMDDLLPLVPLTRSQLKVAGGFAIPGRVRGKWHSWNPPEIRAISDAPDGFTVRLLDTHRYEDVVDAMDDDVLVEWSDDGTGVVVQPLVEFGLADGDYRVELIPVGSKDPIASTTLMLRSSDTPDLQHWANIEPVGYDGGGLGVLGAVHFQGPPPVQGHGVVGAHELRPPHPDLPSMPSWVTTKDHSPRVPRSQVRITLPDTDSCIRTGRHIESIDTVPTDSSGKPLQAWSYGRCTGCGLVRRYPTRLKRSSYGRGRNETVIATPSIRDLSALVPVAQETGRDYATAFDALLHAGGGAWSHLVRIALQLEPSMLFVDQFARNLEVLGHIDVRRDPRTLHPTHWEVCPTALVSTGSAYLFAGFWPNHLYSEVVQHLEEERVPLTTMEVREAPTQYFADTASLSEASIRHLRDVDIPVVDRAWNDLVSVLPPLSEVLDALPRQTASLTGDISWFNTKEARWVPVSSMEAPGGYRVRRFSTIDVVRTAQDVQRGTLARSTVQLSKHVGALIDGRPLLAFDRDSGSLLVPLGADLPALYGRAVVASSGLPPIAVPKARLVKYESVPEELARRIYDLMSR